MSAHHPDARSRRESSAPGPACDVLVVGAGPAGAVAARELSRQGRRVVLVDKAEFPRWKVCGCCLNGAALDTLRALGLGELPTWLEAAPLARAVFATQNRTVTLKLPAGVALSRTRLDQALITEARSSGADFRPATKATWAGEAPDSISILLESPGRRAVLRARAVVAADGLAAGFTRGIRGIESSVAKRARIGAGATLDAGARDYASGAIYMAVGRGGYVGLVRVEDGRLNIAAAFDTGFVHSAGGLGRAAATILQSSGLPPIEGLVAARWRGTPPLTRQYLAPQTRRLFLIGDAAEYVEPFTGEGMAWALAAAHAVTPHVTAAIEGRRHAAPAEWARSSADLLGRRRQRCRWVAAVLRRPWLTGIVLRLLRAYPRVAAPYLRSVNR